MSVKFSRRRFLKEISKSFGYLGLSAVGLELLGKSILQKALAASGANALNPSGYYVHWTFPSAPPRWYFDLLLTPQGQTSSNFIPGGFGNIFENVGSAVTVAHRADKHVINGKTIYLPPVWSFTPPGQTDFKSILPHTLFIRGMDMEIDNHGLSNQRQVSPVIGGISISGAVADKAARAFPAITDPGSSAAQGFKSARGLARYDATYTVNNTVNPVKTLLKPFEPFFAGRSQHSGDQIALQEQAFKEFEKQATQKGINSGSLNLMYDNAMQLIADNVISIGEQWQGVFSKYSNLIESAFKGQIGKLPGVMDKAIPGSTTDVRFRYERTAADTLNLADIRQMIQDTTIIPRLAENFAIAELTLDSLTSNLTLSALPFQRVNFNGTKNSTHDQHFVGTVVQTIQNTLFYRAFLAGLTEQVRVLKEKGLFDRTVIHISAEFNRAPRIDGSGSDHLPHGSNATIISGMINEVGVVGNIKKGGIPGSTNYVGTFGYAANYELDKFVRPIQVNDVALTITSMLGVESVVTNGRSLLALDTATGKWKVRKAEAKNEA